MWEIENLKIYAHITLALLDPEVPILVGHGETFLYVWVKFDYDHPWIKH